MGDSGNGGKEGGVPAKKEVDSNVGDIDNSGVFARTFGEAMRLISRLERELGIERNVSIWVRIVRRVAASCKSIVEELCSFGW